MNRVAYSADADTALASDLPSQITAQVSEAVCDGPIGKVVLRPDEAGLIGQYDAEVAFGERRCS